MKARVKTKMFNVVEGFPTNDEFNELFSSVGWGERDEDKINMHRKASCFSVKVYLNEKIVGMARIVGDGSYYTVYDVVTHGDYQKKGVGRLLMESVVNYYKSIKDEDTYLYLGASYGKEKFYEKFGFVSRPYGHIGSGMKYDPEYENK